MYFLKENKMEINHITCLFKNNIGGFISGQKNVLRVAVLVDVYLKAVEFLVYVICYLEFL